jgi:AMIN domain/Outer membrane protein beta-barrel domain
MRFPIVRAALSIVLLLSGTVFGAEKSGQFSISPMIGSYTFGNIFNSKSRTSAATEIKASYNLTAYIALEPNFAFSYTNRSNNHQTFFKYGGDVLLHLVPGGDLVPYLAAGGGGFNFMESNRGVSTATQSYVGGGGGIKYLFHENFALRVDGRANYIINKTDNKQLELLVGLQIPFGGTKPATRLAENRVDEETQQPKAPASMDTQPSNRPSFRVGLPVEADISLSIPPLPDQTTTVTVKSAEPVADGATKPAVHPAANTASVASFVAPVESAAPVRRTVLKNIVIGKDFIDIQTDSPLAGYKQLHLTGPERLSIDLPFTAYSLSQKLIPVNRFGVSNIRIGNYPDSVRIVLDAAKDQFPAYRIETRGNGLRIHFSSKPAKKVPAKHASRSKK